MDQSKNWEEFREACSYNYIPAENMVWADKQGNIGWQASGISPIRKGFSGLVATMGDGRHEWDGYLPNTNQPHDYNPESGFIATANQNVAPADYPFPEALGFEWADNFRGERIKEVLTQDKKFTLEEMGALQNDYLSLPARQLIPFLENLDFESERSDSLKLALLNWDFILNPQSIEAGVYVMWERELRKKALSLAVPEVVQELIGSLSMTRVIEWAMDPSLIFTSKPENSRNVWLAKSFEDAVLALEKKLGPNPKNWQYGQNDYKHALIYHPLGRIVNQEWQDKLNAGPLPQGGYSYTPGASAYGDNNTSGASFRILVDTEDWEKTLGINTPGQSGDPTSSFYKNLFPIWAKNEFVAIPYSRETVKSRSSEIQVFVPMR